MTNQISNDLIEQLKKELAAEQSAARAFSLRENEGGEGYNPHDAKVDSLIGALVEAELQEIIGNLDLYKARWNEAVRKHTVDGKIRNIRDVEKDAGITLNQMNRVKSRIAK